MVKIFSNKTGSVDEGILPYVFWNIFFIVFTFIVVTLFVGSFFDTKIDTTNLKFEEFKSRIIYSKNSFFTNNILELNISKFNENTIQNLFDGETKFFGSKFTLKDGENNINSFFYSKDLYENTLPLKDSIYYKYYTYNVSVNILNNDKKSQGVLIIEAMVKV